jgi:predicted Zn-ribbon and HTH transcriptional regulator
MIFDSKDREYVTGILTGVAMMIGGWEIRTCNDQMTGVQLVRSAEENVMSQFNESGNKSVEWDETLVLDDEACNACGGEGECLGNETNSNTTSSKCPKCNGRGRIVPPALVCSAKLQ